MAIIEINFYTTGKLKAVCIEESAKERFNIKSAKYKKTVNGIACIEIRSKDLEQFRHVCRQKKIDYIKEALFIRVDGFLWDMERSYIDSHMYNMHGEVVCLTMAFFFDDHAHNIIITSTFYRKVMKAKNKECLLTASNTILPKNRKKAGKPNMLRPVNIGKNDKAERIFHFLDEKHNTVYQGIMDCYQVSDSYVEIEAYSAVLVQYMDEVSSALKPYDITVPGYRVLIDRDDLVIYE